MVDLGFKTDHVIIDSIFLPTDLCFESLDIPLFEFEEFSKSWGIHLYILHHLSQVFGVNCRNIVGSIANVWVLSFVLSGVRIAISEGIPQFTVWSHRLTNYNLNKVKYNFIQIPILKSRSSFLVCNERLCVFCYCVLLFVNPPWINIINELTVYFRVCQHTNQMTARYPNCTKIVALALPAVIYR